MRLGVVIPLSRSLREDFVRALDLGISCCQLTCWEPDLFTAELARLVRDSQEELRFDVTALWVGWEGPCVWNLLDGPETIGLVPPAYRDERIRTIERGARFASEIGVRDVITHVGFIPENPRSEEYWSLINSLRYLVGSLAKRGCNFLFETGQETPITLLRTIKDVGAANVGINLDPANLVMNGKGNPVDALDVLGSYVRGVHAKDGVYPLDGYAVGEEVPLGQGRVDFESLIPGLFARGYRGAITIEREIGGEQQIKDILSAKEILEGIIRSLDR